MDRLGAWIHSNYSWFWSLYIIVVFSSLVCYEHLRNGAGWRQSANEFWLIIPVLMICAAFNWFDNGKQRERKPGIVNLGTWIFMTPVVLGLVFVVV